MGRWETYLGFHRFPASFSTGSLLTKSGWYFFVFKYIYICGCIYQLPLPIYKLVFQIFYKMGVPDSGIWYCSHIKWCWVCINGLFLQNGVPRRHNKKNIILIIGGPRPTILNGKCQRGYIYIYGIIFWHSILAVYLTFYSGILSGIYSVILSGNLSGIYTDIFSRSIWHFLPNDQMFFAYVLACYSGMLLWHSILHIFWHTFRHSISGISSEILCGWGPAGIALIHSQSLLLGSGGEAGNTVI